MPYTRGLQHKAEVNYALLFSLKLSMSVFSNNLKKNAVPIFIKFSLKYWSEKTCYRARPLSAKKVSYSESLYFQSTKFQLEDYIIFYIHKS